MKNATQMFRAGMRLADKNAPAILTAFGAVGVVTTAVLTGKATFEAAKKIESHESALNAKREAGTGRVTMTKQQKVVLVWPLYVGAVSSGVLSCGAIVMSHRISSRRAAVLAAAYALNEGKLEEYQDKIKEKFGPAKEKETRDEIAADQVKKDFKEGTVIFSPLDGKMLIHDQYSGRFFWSTKEAVDRAVNEINHEITMSVDSAVTLSDFYDVLELDHISTSDYFGWNTAERCEIDWSTTTTPDGGTPVHSFEFLNPPIMNPKDSASFR